MYFKMNLFAWRGDADTMTALIAAGTKDAVARGEGMVITVSEYSIAVLQNGLGNYEAAADAAQRASEYEELLTQWVLPELVEAAARCGRHTIALAAAQRLSDQTQACGTELALGMGAQVTVLDRSLEVLRRLSVQFDGRVQTIFSTRAAIAEFVKNADMVIGAVLVPGASAPKLITREMLGTMMPGSVIVDIAIDQGGCAETSKATTHSHPTYVVDGVVHYCVANMPGAVARTSTFALNNATLPFTLSLADKGWRKALTEDPHLRAGLNVCAGQVTCEPVAAAHGLPYRAAETLLG